MILKPKLYIMTYRSYAYAWIYYCTHQYLLIFLETKNWKILLNMILTWDLVISIRFFLLQIQNMEMYSWCFLKICILLIHWSHFWRVTFWTRKVSFWGETYLHILNNRIFVKRNFENLNCTKSFKTNIRIYTNFDEWKQQVLLSIKHV
jgi:hypothetical protein